jgi:hypothetical protein
VIQHRTMAEFWERQATLYQKTLSGLSAVDPAQ